MLRLPGRGDDAGSWHGPHPRLALQPARVISLGFASVTLLGTLLLSLPIATVSGRRAPFVDAMFAATSSVSLAGLSTVDPGTYWSVFGQVVIAVLIQCGGLGIMTIATFLLVTTVQGMSFDYAKATQDELRAPGVDGVRTLAMRVVIFSLLTEFLATLAIAARFWVRGDLSWWHALGSGAFHAISAFNNVGISLFSTNFINYAADPYMCAVLIACPILGGLGYPVIVEVYHHLKRHRARLQHAVWSVTTRITVAVTGSLLVISTAIFVLLEWTNAQTFGALSPAARVLAGLTHSVMCRSGGFNTVDIGSMRQETLFVSDLMMFIGGGSAGTAGGIKVTTIGVLALVVWSEMRGDQHVSAGVRRIPQINQRQALAVGLMGATFVGLGTLGLLITTSFSLDQVLFEVVSAFGTVGLTTGITPYLTTSAKWILIVLMFIGRTGTLTLAHALAQRTDVVRFTRPEERTTVG